MNLNKSLLFQKFAVVQKFRSLCDVEFSLQPEELLIGGNYGQKDCSFGKESKPTDMP